jgi:hypothetical protein
MSLETPNGNRANQSTGLDRFEQAFLSAEILRTYTRRNAAFGHGVTSTASTTFWWTPVERLSTEDAKRWDPEFWMGRTGERFQLETLSPSHSRRPSPQRKSVAELILSVKEGLQAAFAERLTKRLNYLAKISQEEYPEQAPIAPESLQDFVAFLESAPKLVYPGVVLTPSGNIQAEWRKGKNRHFAVEFIGNNDVHFVVFAPDPKDPYKTMRASGIATVASLTDIVRPYGVESWVTASTCRAA